MENLLKETEVPKYTAEFERFWKIYPIGAGKKAASKAFQKVTVSVDKLIRAVKIQAAAREVLERKHQFCPAWPHASTWLNGERWDDMLIPNQAALEKQLDQHAQRMNDERKTCLENPEAEKLAKAKRIDTWKTIIQEWQQLSIAERRHIMDEYKKIYRVGGERSTMAWWWKEQKR